MLHYTTLKSPHNAIKYNCAGDDLRLAWPHGIRDTPDKLQLLPHILVAQRVTLCVRCETALGTNTTLLDRIFSRLSSTLCDPVGSLVDASNHLVLVLESGELGGDYTKNDVLVLGEVGKGLEATSARRVILEVVSVNVKVLQALAASSERVITTYLEQLLCNGVISALGEVAAADIVASAKVNTEMHVGRALKALVVELDVRIEHLVGRLVVFLVGGPAFQHVLRAEVGQVGVVDLDVPDALPVENPQLLLVGLCDVLKVLFVVRIHLLGKASSVQVPEVVPARRDDGDFDVLPFAFWQLALHEVDFALVAGLASVADLPNTDCDMVGDFFGFHERLDIGSIRAENASIITLEYTELELLHSVECFEEGTPEHVP
jgi:hypothetical protein